MAFVVNLFNRYFVLFLMDVEEIEELEESREETREEKSNEYSDVYCCYLKKKEILIFIFL